MADRFDETAELRAQAGLQVADLTIGQGAEAKAGHKVSVHYSGWLTDGKPFDSSRDSGSPFTFKLGAGQVIKGWDAGVEGMRIGGRRRLEIPAALAYGSRGVGPIPGNADLIFVVELLAVD
jgi:FKBP-type peptidyl-prolyl cis-trans isomerase